jgi:hypothetical protein
MAANLVAEVAVRRSAEPVVDTQRRANPTADRRPDLPV